VLPVDAVFLMLMPLVFLEPAVAELIAFLGLLFEFFVAAFFSTLFFFALFFLPLSVFLALRVVEAFFADAGRFAAFFDAVRFAALRFDVERFAVGRFCACFFTGFDFPLAALFFFADFFFLVAIGAV
jgi:hypothetical protein